MKINVVKSVLAASDADAGANRRVLDAAGVLAVNILSAPGSGKTSLLENTIPALGPDERCAVLVGDLQTTRDAERLGPRSEISRMVCSSRWLACETSTTSDTAPRIPARPSFSPRNPSISRSDCSRSCSAEGSS